MKNILKSFARRTEGQVTIMFALAAVPLLLATGAAVDRIRLDNARTEMQAALDGAALAAAMAETRTNAQREKLARDYYMENFSYAKDRDVQFKINVTARSVVAESRLRFPFGFMQVAGIGSADLSLTSEVIRPGASKVEVVMVLDYSGSMSAQKKSERMARAAAKMVEDLSAGVKPGQVKVGLVPFSAMVRTTMQTKFTNQFSATESWTGCTQDRAYPFNLTVDTPTDDPRSKWGHIDNSVQNRDDKTCPNYASKSLNILPLTEDFQAVTDQLAAMRPLGYTNIPLGAEFGWNLLDPQEPFTEAAPYSDQKTSKYLILLTDGVQTSPQWGEGDSRSKENGNENLPVLCRNMAAKGITVFAIAYDITDPDVTDLLKQCAGDNYYEPDADATEIAQVFNAISREIRRGAIRLAR